MCDACPHMNIIKKPYSERPWVFIMCLLSMHTLPKFDKYMIIELYQYEIAKTSQPTLGDVSKNGDVLDRKTVYRLLDTQELLQRMSMIIVIIAKK